MTEKESLKKELDNVLPLSYAEKSTAEISALAL